MKHPDWLHKKMLEKNDVLKQRKISELFSSKPKSANGLQTENIENVIIKFYFSLYTLQIVF